MCAHLLQVLTFSSGEGSGHSLKPTICSKVSFFTTSIWVEPPDISGTFAVEALVLTLRREPTILAETWSTSPGSGPTTWVRGASCVSFCVNFMALLMHPCARTAGQTAAPSPSTFTRPVHNASRCLCSLGQFKAPAVPARNTQAASASLTRSAGSCWGSLLFLRFPGPGNTPAHLGLVLNHRTYHCHSCMPCRSLIFTMICCIIQLIDLQQRVFWFAYVYFFVVVHERQICLGFCRK